MADSLSSSDISTSGSDLSDFEGAVGRIQWKMKLCLSPVFSHGELLRHKSVRMISNLHAVVVTKIVKNGEFLEALDVKMAATLS